MINLEPAITLTRNSTNSKTVVFTAVATAVATSLTFFLGNFLYNKRTQVTNFLTTQISSLAKTTSNWAFRVALLGVAILSPYGQRLVPFTPVHNTSILQGTVACVTALTLTNPSKVCTAVVTAYNLAKKTCQQVKASFPTMQQWAKEIAFFGLSLVHTTAVLSSSACILGSKKVGFLQLAGNEASFLQRLALWTVVVSSIIYGISRYTRRAEQLPITPTTAVVVAQEAHHPQEIRRGINLFSVTSTGQLPITPTTAVTRLNLFGESIPPHTPTDGQQQPTAPLTLRTTDQQQPTAPLTLRTTDQQQPTAPLTLRTAFLELLQNMHAALPHQ